MKEMIQEDENPVYSGYFYYYNRNIYIMANHIIITFKGGKYE